MRIAFYSPRKSHLEQELAQGGDPIFLHNLFAALRGRGHDVRVVSRLNIRGVWIGRISALRLFREALEVRREMKRYLPDAWLVYDPSRTYPDLFGWWQRPKRYVLFGAHTWQSAGLPRRWRWLFAFAHRRSLARADKVVAVRPSSAANLLRSHRVSEEQLCVLPHAVKIWEDIPSQQEARQHLGMPLDTTVIMSASRFTEETEPSERKTELILNLLTALVPLDPRVLLLVAGDGPGRWRAEERVAQLNLGGRVRLVGAVPNEDMKWYYAACDFYAYPLSLDRPWVSILEAQACGRPVVALHTASAELTVDAGNTGLLSRDLGEFQEHMQAMAGDRTRCEVMGRAARAYIERSHSIDVRARQIEDMLRGQDWRRAGNGVGVES